MNMLFEETFASSDGKRTSRNIWYGSVDITSDGEYGIEIKLVEDLKYALCQVIKSDLSKNADNPPTETNWYFYGSEMTQESIGSNVLPAIMVRERDGRFITNFSISDHDFAVNIDTVVSFKSDFENYLASY